MSELPHTCRGIQEETTMKYSQIKLIIFRLQQLEQQLANNELARKP